MYLIGDLPNRHCMIWDAPYPEYNARLIFEKYDAAAGVIQRKWLKIYYNPYHPAGTKKMNREYEALLEMLAQKNLIVRMD